MPFITDHGIEHFFNLFQIAELLALRAAGGVTNGTAQIAVITNLDQRQAGMLLMIAAKATIIRAPPLDGSVVNQRHLRRFDEDLSAGPIVVHIKAGSYSAPGIEYVVASSAQRRAKKKHCGYQNYQAERNRGKDFHGRAKR